MADIIHYLHKFPVQLIILWGKYLSAALSNWETEPWWRKEGIFNGAQEAATVNLILEINEIWLQEIQSLFIQDNTIFNKIQLVSPSTLARILKWNQITIKQLYEVPFERNSKKERAQMSICGCKYKTDSITLHTLTDFCCFVFRNIIGHRAIIDVPGQCGANITMCAAISNQHGALHRHANLGPFNTASILTYLDRLHNNLIPPECIMMKIIKETGTLY